MHSDFKELLSAFHARGVKYLVVGGYAVSLHAEPRATKNIDRFIKADPDNAIRVYSALAGFGAPLQGYAPADFAKRGSFFRLGQPPVAIDIESAWERRVERPVEPEATLSASFIGRDDLIAAGRPQDIADVAALRKAAVAKKTRKS